MAIADPDFFSVTNSKFLRFLTQIFTVRFSAPRRLRGEIGLAFLRVFVSPWWVLVLSLDCGSATLCLRGAFFKIFLLAATIAVLKAVWS